jgi:putative membrane protein
VAAVESREGEAVGLRRPHRNLLVYYALQSLLLGPFFPVLLVPRYFKYHTLRYHLNPDGLAAEWGILFRHEIHLGYVRIQDIHLASNLVERWLGLGRVQVQTASGSRGAEMTIEGLPDYEEVRDWIYSRTRGAKGRHVAAPRAEAAGEQVGRPALPAAPPAADPVVAALQEAATEMRRVRELLERNLGQRRSEDG